MRASLGLGRIRRLWGRFGPVVLVWGEWRAPERSRDREDISALGAGCSCRQSERACSRGHLPCCGKLTPVTHLAAVSTGPGTRPICWLAPWTSGDFGSTPAGLAWGSRRMKSGTGGRGTAASAVWPCPGMPTPAPSFGGQESCWSGTRPWRGAAWGASRSPQERVQSPSQPGRAPQGGLGTGIWDLGPCSSERGPAWGLLQQALCLVAFTRCSKAGLRGGFQPTLASPPCGPGQVAEPCGALSFLTCRAGIMRAPCGVIVPTKQAGLHRACCTHSRCAMAVRRGTGGGGPTDLPSLLGAGRLDTSPTAGASAELR